MFCYRTETGCQIRPGRRPRTGDYEIDPKIVGDPRFSELEDDLKALRTLSVVLPVGDLWERDGIYAKPDAPGGSLGASMFGGGFGSGEPERKLPAGRWNTDAGGREPVPEHWEEIDAAGIQERIWRWKVEVSVIRGCESEGVRYDRFAG